MGKGLWGFLRRVVPDTTGEEPVLIFARELLCIRRRVWMWRTIGIAFNGDGRHGDDRTLRKPLFQIVILRLAFGETQAPAIIMDRNDDMIRIVEPLCAAREGLIAEIPLRRSELPDELCKSWVFCW